ncbi:class II fructose-bisphosphate aldolase [Methanohalophilus portucalensis]|uniref:Ketose-bisphosphate aldolase class-II n=1 Tax=Methanohalophilus portucalensis FDF-1 TaxID=523843 RepID=A0A1L9C576_9EURY|nr:class II fructose-bisphosphate aldolase [Methanohalophilus portucalensis]OJH49657.1 ketose-bisphosphate aldolase class-II [Methanohalophilus portucalensis FDF-1]
MSESKFEPLPSSYLFNSLLDKDTIILAANPRISLVMRGIMKAAKDADAPLMVELARSESDLDGGYSGMTPAEFSKRCKKTANEVGLDVWSLHADHIGIKKGTPEDIESTKELVSGQIDAGYTSFAIDASHLFNFQGGNLREELSQNIDATTEIAHHIQDKMDGRKYGLEVEVGEIGREDENGRVLTKPEEAVTFIKALNENGVYPHVIAIANGSAHGNTYDTNGNLIQQVSVDIEQTIAVADALKENGFSVRIAQHGITGTPRELIYEHFPHGDILKGNVATFFQNIVWEVFRIYEPELFSDIRKWTIENFRSKAPEKSDNEIFGKFSKYAVRQFFDRIDAVDENTRRAIDAKVYAETLMFLGAFKAEGTAQQVRDYIKSL